MTPEDCVLLAVCRPEGTVGDELTAWKADIKTTCKTVVQRFITWLIAECKAARVRYTVKHGVACSVSMAYNCLAHLTGQWARDENECKSKRKRDESVEASLEVVVVDQSQTSSPTSSLTSCLASHLSGSVS